MSPRQTIAYNRITAKLDEGGMVRERLGAGRNE